MVLVKPTRVVDWHRKGFRLYWRRRSRHLGRPGISQEVRDLIRKMSTANTLWGAPRIHSELLELGIEVSQATVGRYLPWRPKVPSPTWRSFLRNHMHDTAAVDTFVVVTARFRLLYALLVLGHERRKVSISMSPQTRRKACWHARSPRPSPGTPRLAFYCETATLHMGRHSATASRQWLSSRSSPRRDRRGRTPTSSASSARSAASASITSSSSMNVTCAVCCRLTSPIITGATHTSRSARIARSHGLYRRALQASSSPSHRSAASIIVTNGAQLEPLPATEPVPSARGAGVFCRPPSRLLGARRPMHEAHAPRAQHPGQCRMSLVSRPAGKALPSHDGFLRRDRRNEHFHPPPGNYRAG